MALGGELWETTRESSRVEARSRALCRRLVGAASSGAGRRTSGPTWLCLVARARRASSLVGGGSPDECPSGANPFAACEWRCSSISALVVLYALLSSGPCPGAEPGRASRACLPCLMYLLIEHKKLSKNRIAPLPPSLDKFYSLIPSTLIFGSATAAAKPPGTAALHRRNRAWPWCFCCPA